MSSLVIENAKIWTAAADRPRGQSIAIRDGRIVSIDGARSDAGDGARRIDARGAFVVPGFIDAHVHLVLGGEQLGQLDLTGVFSRAGFEAAVARRHAELPESSWLLAHGWSEDRWGGALPDKSWLAAAGGRPVVAYRMDIHAALVNDAVLERVATDVDPPGGRIERDRSGAPTGLLAEAAAWDLVNPVVPSPTAEERRAGVRAAQTHLHGLGVTTVGSMEYANIVRDVLEPMRDELSLRVRVTMLDRAWPLDLTWATDFPGDDRLAVIGCKAFLDGTLGSRTAAMLVPYADAPDDRGLFVELAASGDLDVWAKAVADAGLSPAMHAIGDAANRRALDVIEALPARTHVRLEHAQHVDPADLPRAGGTILSMQPLHMVDDAPTMLARLGPDRLAGAFAFDGLARAGAMLAFGSDWPVVSACPLLGIRAAVTRLGRDGKRFEPESALTPEAALLAYTRDAARALRMDDAGVLHPGALGDLAMLDFDPFAANWERTPPRVLKTIVGGSVVYE